MIFGIYWESKVNKVYKNYVVDSYSCFFLLTKMVLYSEKNKVRLDGKTVIVTGSNTGIGKETVRELYKMGAYVVMACRNVEKAEEAAKDIVESCKNLSDVGKLAVVQLNLGNIESIKECSKKILEKHERIDILINNAGLMGAPDTKTDDGFEIHFGTNHLGPFLFTLLLLPRIIKSAPARIVNVSSAFHKGDIDFNDLHYEAKPYSPLGAYHQSKLSNILFTKELDRRLKDANINDVTVYSLHPGAIASDLARNVGTTYNKGVEFLLNMSKCFFKTPLEGAQTTIYCAIDEAAGKESGLYYSDRKPTKPTKAAENMDTAEKLWNVSLGLVKLSPEYNPFIEQEN